MPDHDELKLLSAQKLQSTEQMELLDVVDSLRACGLSEIVALPQLIVCGDQSSGKSSVLEAISGIPFPRQDDLCTRFATEVILRRASKDEIAVSIVPGKDRPQVDRDRLIRFHHDLKSKDDFSSLFEIARDAMGLSSAGKSFSNDVLRVEFCGPSQPQLTLVDLPGLIHSETKSQTANDIKIVHTLVSQYLENPRSIILAIVSAKNDINNQVILRRARQVDPQGLRTLGIITKPDLLTKGSKSEEAFIALARNEEVKFSLGWHVVKNLDFATGQSGHDDRDKSESLFFQDSGFNCLPAHTIGINFLRSRLSKVLFNQIRTELPRLVKDIQSQITSTEAARDKLGESREELNEQRLFLVSLSQTFQMLCRDAERGDYDHEFFQIDSDPKRRLCANVMNMHFEFAKQIRECGATWLVSDKHVLHARHRTREKAIKEACVLLKKSRGRELPGLPNSLLVGELFREYSRPWGDLARGHIRKVWEDANTFLELLLRYLADNEACENILQHWLNPQMEGKLQIAFTKLDELLDVHKGYPMTTNAQFINESKRPRQDKVMDELNNTLNKTPSQFGVKVGIEEVTSMLSGINAKKSSDMDQLAAEAAFDSMTAYYEVALNLFTDNVPNLTVQAPIIRKVPDLFCPTSVMSMRPDLVERIAGETEEKIAERASVLRRLKALENGAQICKQYAKRPQSFLQNEEKGVSELPAMTLKSTTADPGNSHSRPASIFSNLNTAQSTENPFRFSAVESPQSLSHVNSSSAGLFPGRRTKTSSSSNPFDFVLTATSSGSSSTINIPETTTPPSLFSSFGSLTSKDINSAKGETLGEETVNPNSSQSIRPNGVVVTTKDLSTGPEGLNDELRDAARFWSAKSTKDVTVVPTIEQEPKTFIRHQNSFHHLCFMPYYQTHSPEELRLADYGLRKRFV